MKYVLSALVEMTEIVRKHPVIFVVYLIFGLLPWIAASEVTPPIVDFSLSFLALGWFAARFFYLHLAYLDKPILWSWYRVFEKVLRYSFRLLPITLFLLLAVFVPITILSIWYGRWYSSLYLDSGMGLTTAQVLTAFVPAIFNSGLWREFFTQSLGMSLFYQLTQVMVLIGLLVLKIMMILIIVEKFNVKESLVKSFFYINQQLPLLGSFLILRILANMFLYLVLFLVNNSLNRISGLSADFVFIAVSALVNFSLDAYILSYYLKADKSLFVTRNVMRWWRSRGRAGF